MKTYVIILLAVSSAFAQNVTPYMLIDISRQFDENGQLKSETRFLVAVNREGTLVSIDLDPEVNGTKQILDFRRGASIVVDPARQSVSKFSYQPQRPEAACEHRFLGLTDARVSVDNDGGSIQGVPVQRVSVDQPNGSEMVIFMAPSLGCQMLRTVLRRNGQAFETRVAKGLRIGDPDPDLFRVSGSPQRKR